FLRFITIFSVLLLLINPKLEQTTYYNEKPNLVVAVDNSESVAFLKQDKKTEALIANLKSDKALNQRFNLEFYTFGKRIKATDSLTFNEKQSNTALVFDRLSQVYNTTTTPTII